MKLLGWMHRKFKQNNNEPLKDFSIGNSCTCLVGQPSLDDHQYFIKPNSATRPLHQGQRDPPRKSFPGLGAAPVKDDYQDEASAEISDLFDGFLAIGTLGSDPAVNPSTPTFAISVDNITEKETEVTENELKLINDELEKVLGAEAKEDGCNISSGRTSHVSAGRSSHGSTITISGKPIEGSETNGNGTTVFPLQGYLLGSAIELPERTTVPKKDRTSLGELFQRTKFTDENSADMFEKEEKPPEKEVDKSAVHIVKKVLKRKKLNVSSRSSTTNTGGNTDSASVETKLNKILHMFRRKVHPESSTAAKKHGKPQKNVSKYKTSDGGKKNTDQLLPDEDIMIYPKRALSRRSGRRSRSQSNPPQFILNGSDSNREYWIKTDENYLVLEL